MTDEERHWIFLHPETVGNIDTFVSNNLQKAKAVITIAFVGKLGLLGKMIRSLFSSSFEERMFDRYWSGEGGTYVLTQGEFNDVIGQGTPHGDRGPSNVVINGQATDSQVWDWYPTERYNLALGHAAVYFKKGENSPIGFRDEFNFNPGVDGHRSWSQEALTLIGASFTTFGARDFSIRFP